MTGKFIGILCILTLARLGIMRFIGITNDEAYYWVWSRHPALSYYDHPPMVAFIVKVFTGILGNTPFAIHFAGLFFFTLFVVLLYNWSREMFPEPDALKGTVIVAFSPLFFLGGSVLTPDAILSFFWVLTLMFIYRALKNKKSVYWYLSGISAGLGALTKYSMFFVPAAIFAFLFFSKQHRGWLRKKEPYVFLLLTIIIFSPVLVWNAGNGWASFAFHLATRHTVSFSLSRFLQFIISQLVHISPVAYVYCWLAFWTLFRKGFSENNWTIKYLFFTSFPLVAMFTAASFFTGTLSHWPAFGYLGGLIAIPTLFKVNKKTMFKINFALSMAIIIIYTVQVFYPFVKIKKDPTDDLYGWNDVGRQVMQISSSLPGEEFLLCSRYETGSQLSFATGQEVYVFQPGHITAFQFWHKEGEIKGRNALYLTHSRYFTPPERIYNFNKITLVKEIPLYRAGRQVRTFYLYYCEDFLGVRS
jgi:undecaprenyl-diphosphatase